MLKLPLKINSNKETNKFLAIDLDADGVRCLAFYLPTSADSTEEMVSLLPVAKIIGVGKQRVEPGAIRGGVIVDLEIVTQAVRSAVEQASKDNEDEIKDVIFGVNGSLSLGLITTARVVRESKLPINQKEMKDLYDKITRSAFSEAQNQIMRINGDSEPDLELITSSTVYTKLDGQIVDNPINMEASSLEVAYFTSFTPSFHLKSLQSIAKSLGLNVLAIGSNMYCLNSILKRSLGNHLDCVILSVDTEFTDVGVVFGGGIVSTRSLEIGSYHFTNEISKKTGLSYKESETMRRTYAYGKLTPTESALIHDSLAPALDVWLNGIRLLFGEFNGVKTFAPKVYLVGEAAELPDIYDMLTKEPWTRSIQFKEPPQYQKVSLKNLNMVSDATGLLGSLEFVMTASLSIIYLEMKGFIND